MKADIHPQYSQIKVTCACGNTVQRLAKSYTLKFVLNAIRFTRVSKK